MTPNRERIRILFIPSAEADNCNAQSVNAREIALRLDADRFEVAFFYWNKPDPRLLGRPNIRLLLLPSRFKTLSFLRQMLSGPEIVAYTDYSPASYLFVHLPRMLRRRTRTVLHTEGPPHFEGTSRALRFLFHGIVGQCDLWTAITDYVAQSYKQFLPYPPDHILPVGVDCRFFSPPEPHRRNGSTVLFVGALLERKGVLDFVEIASHFRETKFRMIGAGRNGFEQTVANKIAKMALDNVVLEGERSKLEIAEAMRESDVFLFPSRVEGMPKVTLEASASGLPCIICRDYETPSVVDGVTGFQVGTKAEMIEKLSRLLFDARLRQLMGRAARQLAEEYDWDKISRKWEEAYLSISSS